MRVPLVLLTIRKATPRMMTNSSATPNRLASTITIFFNGLHKGFSFHSVTFFCFDFLYISCVSMFTSEVIFLLFPKEDLLCVLCVFPGTCSLIVPMSFGRASVREIRFFKNLVKTSWLIRIKSYYTKTAPLLGAQFIIEQVRLFCFFLGFVFLFPFFFLGHLGFLLLFLIALIGLATIFSHCLISFVRLQELALA